MFSIVRSFVLGIIVTTIFNLSVFASDLQQPHNWQGLHVGFSIGGVHGAADSSNDVIDDGAYFVPGDPEQLGGLFDRKIDGQSFTGSFIAGYDFQKDNITYGIETDLTVIDFSETEGVSGVPYDTLPGTLFSQQDTIETRLMFSLRPKVGYAVGKALFHVSAGPSIGKFKYSSRFSDSSGVTASFSDSKIALGVSSGLGVNYMIGDGWSLRGDYLFSYFPDIVDGRSALSNDAQDGFKYDADFQSHNLRFGLTKRF
ncbi:outer membrane beta-barrel protein [Kiloniella laminariae]|uniref:Outer membrane beta-barrel protein n=1 Tax=Kiloniella laminariae TaxID=454162 RepID=A0ABT4LH47_9PROT|nr:outer membrane beta-barrel protein [Kiloniella laminariae]MCZ4280430.1 outer membrane beta-barrel protein [Kiloniella laminariae]